MSTYKKQIKKSFYPDKESDCKKYKRKIIKKNYNLKSCVKFLNKNKKTMNNLQKCANLPLAHQSMPRTRLTILITKFIKSVGNNKQKKFRLKQKMELKTLMKDKSMNCSILQINNVKRK